MTAYNVVRFKVKPGRDQEFIDAHKDADPDFDGMRRFSMINTGPGSYCIIGEWESFDHLAAARPDMIGMLDTMRHLLEDFGSGLGITDPVSGEAILELGVPKKKKAKRKATKAAKPAAKKKAAKKKPSKPSKKSKKR
jgi:hypothetical protein